MTGDDCLLNFLLELPEDLEDVEDLGYGVVQWQHWHQQGPFASFALAVTSFSRVSFFWMAALARLSSDLAIIAACLALVAA